MMHGNVMSVLGAVAVMTACANPASDGLDAISFAKRIPFSMRGSYYTVGYVSADPSEPYRSEGVWVQTLSTQAKDRHVALLAPYLDGAPVKDVKFDGKPWSARIATKSGSFEICFADTKTLLVRGDSPSLSLKVDFHLPQPYQPISEVPVKGGGRVAMANGYKNAGKYIVDVRSGKWNVDCEWDGRHSKTTEVFIEPEGGRPVELAIWDVEHEWDGTLPKGDFDSSVASRRSEFASFLSKMPSVPAKYLDARASAALVLWSAAVEPRGNIRRESILMSKNWMNRVWSWDHAFDAVGLADADFELAWNQFMTVFDHQDSHGQLPDCVGDGSLVYGFVKPPVHGWALRRIMRGREIPRDRLEEAYRKISLQANWWLTMRDRDGNGLAEFDHGNDSGWDNSTAFRMLPPIETPELQAYLAVEMDVLADVAEKLGRPGEAKAWCTRAKEICAKMEKVLFDEEGRPLVRQVATGRTSSPTTLETRLAVIAGDMLSERVRRELVREISEGGYRMGHALATEPQGEWFRRDGYWLGPVWAPEVMIAVDGLRACGERKLADELVREFCDMVAKSGFAENFDAITGDPLRDPAYSWTASVFLTLAHEMLEAK